MKSYLYWGMAALAALGGLASAQIVARPAAVAHIHRPELEYLEAVNDAGPTADPQLLFLLMAQYANANRHGEGVDRFNALLKKYGPGLSDVQKSLYLSALGVLRAGHAHNVPIFSRIGWVRDTIATLDDAKRRSGGDVFVVRWMAAVAFAQLPAMFGRKEMAYADLHWCLTNAGKAPHAGWLREVHYQLATLYHRDGDEVRSREQLRLSGYTDLGKPITLITASAVDAVNGHTFYPRTISEVVPGKVFVLSGFEFTEYGFVVSQDGRELIAIDAGTRPDSARAAYEALLAYSPGLPPLTTLVITHSHWDHIGGYSFFRSLNPALKIYARDNYREELTRVLGAPNQFAKRFFGERFSTANLDTFTPDATVAQETVLAIGDTRLELIPVQGGETRDALLVNLPDLGVMFAGDFIMPYLGAPFVEEGSLDGLLDAMGVVERKRPRRLLHGHRPLTDLFGTPDMLPTLRSHLVWLRSAVIEGIRRGSERAVLQQANLMPPGLIGGDVRAQLPYLVMRENVINRIYHQTVGYWEPDLTGMDSISRADRGAILVDYLKVSETQLAGAVEQMVADGQYELAASTLAWSDGRFSSSRRLHDAERQSYLKLTERFQDLNPFKAIVYSGRIGFDTRQMGADGAEPLAPRASTR